VFPFAVNPDPDANHCAVKVASLAVVVRRTQAVFRDLPIASISFHSWLITSKPFRMRYVSTSHSTSMVSTPLLSGGIAVAERLECSQVPFCLVQISPIRLRANHNMGSVHPPLPEQGLTCFYSSRTAGSRRQSGSLCSGIWG
jgi:hypothetical protein